MDETVSIHAIDNVTAVSLFEFVLGIGGLESSSTMHGEQNVSVGHCLNRYLMVANNLNPPKRTGGILQDNMDFMTKIARIALLNSCILPTISLTFPLIINFPYGIIAKGFNLLQIEVIFFFFADEISPDFKNMHSS